ncbi:MAG: IS6 family transposase [Defluviimonas sp.]|nr:IS6 family transposase [Defluviimonas sp.]
MDAPPEAGFPHAVFFYVRHAASYRELEGIPAERVVIEMSGANLAGNEAVNVILKFSGGRDMIEIRLDMCLNEILEPDRRFSKRITGPMTGFEASHSATAALADIEAARMTRKGQYAKNPLFAVRQFRPTARLGNARHVRRNP